MPRLKQTLVDACVVIGVDNNTDLTHATDGPPLGDEQYEKYGPFKQHVLGVFTESLAYFPESFTKVEGEPFYEESQVICPNSTVVEHGGSPQSASSGVRRSISYKPEAKRSLPFSHEVTSSLPTFCFPEGGYIYRKCQEPQINYLVLTDMEGQRTYAVSSTIYCPFAMIESVAEKGNFILLSDHGDDESIQGAKRSVVYVPVCVCLVSFYPYLNTLKDCLSSLIPQLEGKNINNIWRPIMKMSTIVSTICVPPPGPLAIKFSLFGSYHTLHPPSEAGRRVIDIDLQIPLLIFRPEVIVKIITCFLTQQRMVFVSSTYALLTLVIESIFTYMDPISWRLTYVPVLPNSLGDLIEAPGPFIMGVHSSLRNKVKIIRRQPETPSIVLVDIDKGEIDIDEHTNIVDLPEAVAQSLRVRLRKAASSHQVKMATLPTKFTYEEMIEQKRILTEKTQLEIKETFLDMLISLFGDVYNHMIVSERFFEKNAYLQSRHDDERSFFIEVSSTDAFERFVDDRMEHHERRDVFTVLGERCATQRKPPTRSRSSFVIQSHLQHIEPIFNPVTETFTVPLLLEECLASGNFYRVYCNSLTRSLDSLGNKNIRLRACFLYLRGFAHIACNRIIEGLRDFHALYASAPELFPRDYASEVVNRLEPNTLATLQQESFYKQTAMFRTFTSKELDRKRNPSRKFPNDPLNRAEFEKRAKTLHKLTMNTEQVEWLFSVLSGNEDCVQPNTFRELYKILSDLEKQSENREVSGVKIVTKSPILKVSQLISSMIGMGRLVLTTDNLYFIKDGARNFQLITHMVDIKELNKFQQHSVFYGGLHAIRIINSDRNIPPFQACLKEERDLWFTLISEISAAQKKALAMTDKNLIDQGKNNVFLAQALLELQYSLKTAEGACFFMKKGKVDSEGLSEETRECLEVRLDPCVRESKRTTVMSIAYVPGNPNINDTASIWCGMGSGAIMIYETDRWSCVSELRYAKNRISCLLLVTNNQLWAASYDSVIYVINTDTKKSEQQLQNHTDFVSDIITQEQKDGKTLVWSSSFNGQIICWDPEAREALKSFMVKNVRTLSRIIMIREKNLWCVTNDRILIVDIESPNCPTLQKLYTYNKHNMPTLLECTLKVSDRDIWVAGKSKGALTIWNTETLEHKEAKLKDEDIQITCMVKMMGMIWVGNKDGKMFIIDPESCSIERTLHAHTDLVRSMCVTREGHVITGSSSKEGKLCVWNAMYDLDIIDGKKRKLLPGYEIVDKANLPSSSDQSHFE